MYSELARHLSERAEMGMRKYGTHLSFYNRRNPYIDAYQETLDLIMYLRQVIEETDVRYFVEVDYHVVQEPKPRPQPDRRRHVLTHVLSDLLLDDIGIHYIEHPFVSLYVDAIRMAEKFRLTIEGQKL